MPKVVVTDAKGLVQESGEGFEVLGASADATPAHIALKAAGGTVYYLSVDSDGKLRIHDAVPDAGAQGNIVGTQGA